MTEAVDRSRTGVEPARPDDAGAVARLHAGGIAEGFLSTLGPRFLTHLYRAMSGRPNATLFVSRDEDGPGHRLRLRRDLARSVLQGSSSAAMARAPR